MAGAGLEALRVLAGAGLGEGMGGREGAAALGGGVGGGVVALYGWFMEVSWFIQYSVRCWFGPLSIQPERTGPGRVSLVRLSALSP